MNRHLQKIQDFIQRTATLSADEKAVLTKAVIDTDTEITITEFKLDRTDKVKRTTAILLEETIEELEQKRKAVEEKNRDLEIEASLERVRAVAMGMRRPDDMLDICRVISNQLETLNVTDIRNVQTAIIYEAKELYVNYEYYRLHDKTLITEVGYDEHPIQASFVKQMLEGPGTFFNRSIKGKEVKEWLEYQKTTNVFIDSYLDDANSLNYYWYSMGPVALGISTYNPLSEADLVIFERFRNVFGLAYTRYLDVEKALSQAREAQIQLALERVRAKTMAMQHSDELREVVVTVYEQLQELNFDVTACNIITLDRASGNMQYWVSGFSQEIYPLSYQVPHLNHPLYETLLDSWLNGAKYTVIEYSGEMKKSFDDIFFTQTEFRNVPDAPKKIMIGIDSITLSTAFVGHVSLQALGPGPLSAKNANILQRFTVVFEQTYTRFLDLQKAEAQARKAQIEAALERTRTQSMIMQHSSELNDTLSVFHEQVLHLGFGSAFSFLWLPDEKKDCHLFWAAWAEDDFKTFKSKAVDYPLDRNDPATAQCLIDWKNGDTVVSYHVPPEEVNNYFAAWHELIDGVMHLTPKHFAGGLYYVEAFMKYGCFGIMVKDAVPDDEKKILARFAVEFERTYTRFLDLQKAEAQAREAIKQTSLDRVRGEIASMRTTNDLERIIPLVWNELTILGIPFLRCGVFIMDEEAELIHTHLSTPDGKALAAFNLPFNAEGIGREILPAWRKKQMAIFHWSAEEFAANTETLVSRGAVKSTGGYVTNRPDTTLELHFFPFLQGMLYAGNNLPLTDAEKDLVQSLADAFSTAYARYDDFNRLELAKLEVERTLTDLKAAQTRLIQSEKMASLGELTAGIAHEIQNPLNFVNNFSEVNQEMIDEMEEELKAGNIEEALAIAADIRQNEEKINHHGKRADGIVKGMLQHSRSSAGEKQPTNLNAIADEFFKLSYHGLRANDKTFNAELISDFDDTLPDINVLPQDIGRVMLNLFNNAFYAVNQKVKTAGAGYKPTVTVTTFAPTGGGWAAKVRDNGVGIPDSIKEKIMQPFFTTKPTGEGTGLGLSLTYDMVVKGHGGSIAVDTKEGEFTEFTIKLPRQ